MTAITAPVRLRRHAGGWLQRRLTRALFSRLRVEVTAIRCKAAYMVLPWRWNRLRAAQVAQEQLVNVACGPHVADGFLNIDLLPCDRRVMQWDCRRSLPVSDGSAAGIRAEHFIERLDPHDELPVFLRNARRALREGGVLRIVVPDAERLLRAYCRDDAQGFSDLAVPDPFPEDLPTRMDVVNHVFHQWNEHRWAYDFETLTHRLHAAGFSRAERSAFAESIDPRLACDQAVHASYSLYVDAVK